MITYLFFGLRLHLPLAQPPCFTTGRLMPHLPLEQLNLSAFGVETAGAFGAAFAAGALGAATTGAAGRLNPHIPLAHPTFLVATCARAGALGAAFATGAFGTAIAAGAGVATLAEPALLNIPLLMFQ